MIDDSEPELIDELADEFLTNCLRGMRPEISDYCEAYPWLAGEIRQLFPMLQFLESNKDRLKSFQVPEVVGSYRIQREIGRGGMGVVFEAHHEETRQRVALKVLSPDNDGSGGLAISRFEREAQAVSRIDHPHVVRLFEVGQQDQLRFLAVQLIDGSSLDRIIRLLACSSRSNPERWFESVMRHVTEGQCSFAASDYFAWVADLGLRIARALHYAHQAGVLHRDVKPANLLVDRAGHTWLTDFGLAKTGDAKLTRTGQIVGTLRYLAPERLRGSCDCRADVYGLGLTLYELLTFRAAFAEKDRLELIAAIEKSAPIPPHKIVSTVPRDLEKVVMRAIARHPKSRYKSAEEMAQALESCDTAPASKSGGPLTAIRDSLRRSR